MVALLSATVAFMKIISFSLVCRELRAESKGKDQVPSVGRGFANPQGVLEPPILRGLRGLGPPPLCSCFAHFGRRVRARIRCFLWGILGLWRSVFLLGVADLLRVLDAGLMLGGGCPPTPVWFRVSGGGLHVDPFRLARVPRTSGGE